MSILPDSDFGIDANGNPRSFRAIANNNPSTDNSRSSTFLNNPTNINTFSNTELTSAESSLVGSFYRSYPNTLTWSLSDTQISQLRNIHYKITGISADNFSASEMYTSLNYHFTSKSTQRDNSVSNQTSHGSSVSNLLGSSIFRRDVENENQSFGNISSANQQDATLRAASRFPQNTKLLFYPEEIVNGDINSRAFYGNRVMNFIRFDILQTIGGGIKTSNDSSPAAIQWNNLNLPIETRTALRNAILGVGGGAIIAGDLGAKVGGVVGLLGSLPDGAIKNELNTFKELAQAASSGDVTANENLKNFLKNPEKASILGSLYALATDKSTISDRVLKNPVATILLYCPTDIRSDHNMQYSDTDLTTATRISEILNTVFNNNAQISGELAKMMGVNAANELLSGLNDGTFQRIIGGEGIDLNKIIGAKTRQVPMPNMEYLFQQVSRRSFGFDFDFYPKSKIEIENTKEIIRLFQKHSHPRISDAGKYYIMPDIFRVSFMTFDNDGKLIPNSALPIYKLCACNSLSINYAPGQLSTLDRVDTDENGKQYRMPLGIKVSLNFTELELLHQGHFEKGTQADTNARILGQNTFQSIINDIG